MCVKGADKGCGGTFKLNGITNAYYTNDEGGLWQEVRPSSSGEGEGEGDAHLRRTRQAQILEATNDDMPRNDALSTLQEATATHLEHAHAMALRN